MAGDGARAGHQAAVLAAELFRQGRNVDGLTVGVDLVGGDCPKQTRAGVFDLDADGNVRGDGGKRDGRGLFAIEGRCKVVIEADAAHVINEDVPLAAALLGVIGPPISANEAKDNAVGAGDLHLVAADQEARLEVEAEPAATDVDVAGVDDGGFFAFVAFTAEGDATVSAKVGGHYSATPVAAPDPWKLI